ncbi:synaptonemal complex central element protein 2 [Coturnix japonica]|uniref:synaptonemal complex central element protein 2 n=1 Tax=Coturnix japonica TaxID=93934 RepID=UPI000776B0D5|nr:synaptonemal complex central element protein 2 [Coturnix japonica]XP_015706106.1 synaptonemal complex central element protein 2 [Coturnix japonica]
MASSHHPDITTALQDNEAALLEPEETHNDAECCPGPGREKAHEENSGMEASGPAVLDRQASSRYFAALDSSVGDLRQRAQSLIDRLNDSRKEDHSVMSGFRDSLQLKVSNLAEQLEERLFQLYSLHNELIQERLQELAEVMERVRQAEAELQQVCHTVEEAYRDLCLQPET